MRDDNVGITSNGDGSGERRLDLEDVMEIEPTGCVDGQKVGCGEGEE